MNDLRALEAFVWIARLGHFRAAAARLNVTQPAISARIAALEEQLGVRLFERKNRQVGLTSKGSELLTHAERMLDLREAMQHAANERVAVRGHFRFGVSDTLVHTWFPNLVDLVHQRFPLLTLEIHVDIKTILMQALGARQVDIAFVTEPVSDASLTKVGLGSYALEWFASPALDLPHGPIPLRTIASWPIITHVRNSRPYSRIQEMLAREGITDAHIYTSPSVSTSVTMVKRGVGIGTIPTAVVGEELRARTLRRLDVTNAPLPSYDFVAAYPTGPQSMVASAVAKLARQASAVELNPVSRPSRRRASSTSPPRRG